MFRALVVAVAAAVIPGTALADSPIVRDAVGRVAGYYVGGTFGPAVRVVSSTGYTFMLTGDGRVQENNGSADGSSPNGMNELFYTSANCVGQPYARSFSNFSGFVFRANGNLLYAPKGELALQRPVISRSVGSECFGPSSAVPLLPVYPNDEAVTGVPDVDFVPPIQIVIARDVSDVFRNGYEAPKA